MIVPHRGLEAAKTRLAPVLSPTERVDLARRLLLHVIEVALATIDIDGDVMVISPDVALASVVGPAGATLVVQDGLGLNAGLDQARAAAVRDRVETLVVLHGDIPNLRAADVRSLVAALPRPVGVAIAPDRAGTGTNALVLSPPDAIPFRFGVGSFALHCTEAAERDIPLVAVDRAGLAFDLDTPADLMRWLELGDAA